MRSISRSDTHIVSQVAWRRSFKRTLTAAALAAALAAPTWAAQAVDPDAVAHDQWHASMLQNPPPGEGCYHASYPNVVWDSVECKVGHPRVEPVRVRPADGSPDVAGNTNDYVAKSKGLMNVAQGFLKASGVKSEEGVGVSEYHNKGILGPNEYSLQLNTNANETTSACAHHSGCTVWQQFLYSPDYYVEGEAEVYIQYWLLNWGTSACPDSTWWRSGDVDCYKNSPATPAPDVPVTELSNLVLAAEVQSGYLDSVVLYDGTEQWYANGHDSVLDISSVWNEAEFNVVGNTGGSRADFNKGSSITIDLVLQDGTVSAPTCVAHAGTTGESNNLNLGSCKASTGFDIPGTPYIQFTESN
jgi:hypothetical protein